MSSPCALANLLVNNSDFGHVPLARFELAITDPVTLQPVAFLKRISYAYILPIIVCFGLFGDVMSILVLSHPLMRLSGVIYSYLLALAVTDIFTLLSTVPMVLWLTDVKLCSWLGAWYYAHIGFPLTNAFMCASVWIVVFFTFCQFVAVCYPFNTTFRSKRFLIWFITFSYFIGAAVYFPWAWKKIVVYVGNRSQFSRCPYVACDNEKIKTSCWFEPYQWTREALSRLIPVFVIAFFNVRILFEYKRSANQRSLVVAAGSTFATVGGQATASYPKKCEKEQKRLLKTLLTLTGLFFLCTLPAAALTIFVSDGRETNLPFQIIRAVTNILEITRFALNFYFYCLINPNIRALFVKRVTCQKVQMTVPLCREARRGNYALRSLSTMRKQDSTKQESRTNQSLKIKRQETTSDERLVL